MRVDIVQRPANPLTHGNEVTISLSSLLHKFQDRSAKVLNQELSEVCKKNKVHGKT